MGYSMCRIQLDNRCTKQYHHPVIMDILDIIQQVDLDKHIFVFQHQQCCKYEKQIARQLYAAQTFPRYVAAVVRLFILQISECYRTYRENPCGKRPSDNIYPGTDNRSEEHTSELQSPD